MHLGGARPPSSIGHSARGESSHDNHHRRNSVKGKSHRRSVDVVPHKGEIAASREDSAAPLLESETTGGTRESTFSPEGTQVASEGTAENTNGLEDGHRKATSFRTFRLQANEERCSELNGKVSPASLSRQASPASDEFIENKEYRSVNFSEAAENDDDDATMHERRSSTNQLRKNMNMAVNSKVAAGKAISILEKIQAQGTLDVETSSVYGAALVLPQIARSTEWSGTFTALAIRSYILLFINIVLQGFLLCMIGEEQFVLYPFAGQMHLCDFGAAIPHVTCADDPTMPNCKGPDGTPLSYPRLYSYDIWATRMYVKTALKALFPDRIDDINSSVDPGEYGVENYWCRAVCIFIFMMAVVDDLNATVKLLHLLTHVPSIDAAWISYEAVRSAEEKETMKEEQGMTELDFVKLKVAGMPYIWKVLNFFLIFVPKFALWLSLACSGVHHLMETADIMDTVVNAMALTFVLDIDELVFARLATEVTKQIMSRIEGMTLYDTDLEDKETEDEVLTRFYNTELGYARITKLLKYIFPIRIVMILAAQIFFVQIYYWRNCKRYNGGFVSEAMSVPDNPEHLNILPLMFGLSPPLTREHFWEMPE